MMFTGIANEMSARATRMRNLCMHKCGTGCKTLNMLFGENILVNFLVET